MSGSALRLYGSIDPVAAKLAELSAACEAQILAGYTSAALGAPFSYPARGTDQRNMAASVLDAQRVPPAWQAGSAVAVFQDAVIGDARMICIGAGTTGAVAPSGPGPDGSVTWAAWFTPFWCADVNGAWAMRPHTAAQIQQAGADGKIAILLAQQKLASLNAEVAAVTTPNDLAAITW